MVRGGGVAVTKAEGENLKPTSSQGRSQSQDPEVMEPETKSAMLNQPNQPGAPASFISSDLVQ